jgi:nicotinate-nucleotide pyrophosphorylase (carboxylating)
MDILNFLAEDKAQSDITTQEIIKFLGVDPVLNFELLAKEQGVFSGTRWLNDFEKHGYVKWKEIFDEGKPFPERTVIAKGNGKASLVLSAERTLLNGLQALCGISTHSDRYVKKVREIAKRKNMAAPAVLHTRKILPGMRDYIADALGAAGVGRHRFTLADRILVKDNHLMLLKTEENLRKFIRSLNSDQMSDALFEADNEVILKALIEENVRNVMLDNFTREQLEKILPTLPKDLVVEISGGIHMDTLEDFVLPGVHRMSIGALTHRAKSLDISLEATE